MPRRKRVIQSTFPYHINARCINRDWFALPMQETWQIMVNELFFIHHAYDVKIHSFVLMSNHFHLIMTTPKLNISQAMQQFMFNTSRNLTRSSGRINQCWGARHYPCVINSVHYYLHTYKYVYQNPVVAGLCQRVEDYPFSTLHGLLGFSQLVVPLEEDTTLFSDVEGTIDWLNTPIETADRDAVRHALLRPTFKLAKCPNSKRPHHLEVDAL